MRTTSSGRMRPNRLSYAVSLALASLVAGNAAYAQENQAVPNPPRSEEHTSELQSR